MPKKKKTDSKWDGELVDSLSKIEKDWVEGIGIGAVTQFESMTKVDFDYFWRRLFPSVVKTDDEGNDVLDDNGDPVWIPDPEAQFNPAPIPHKTKCCLLYTSPSPRD